MDECVFFSQMISRSLIVVTYLNSGTVQCCLHFKNIRVHVYVS